MKALRLARRALLATIRATPLPHLLRPLTRGAVPVLMLHRFADPALGTKGHDAAQLREYLTWLRRHNYRFLALSDLLRLLREEPTQLSHSVAFTVDDGYDDFLRVGWPVFAEFDCPVTVFLTSDFADGRMWFWWDQVEYLIEHSRHRNLTISFGTPTRVQDESRAIHLDWSDDASRQVVTQYLLRRLKIVPDEERLAILEGLAEAVGRGLPETAPEQYAPLQWRDVRALAGKGVAFGPHSMTHPILARTSAAKSEAEITGSWSRVQAECPGALPVFCYPNGLPGEFSSREIATVKQAGLDAALAAHDGYVTASDLATNNDDRYCLPRFPYPRSLPDLVEIVSGVKRVGSILKRPWGGHRSSYGSPPAPAQREISSAAVPNSF